MPAVDKNYDAKVKEFIGTPFGQAPVTPPTKTATKTATKTPTPGEAASARLQAQADAYFAANPDIDPLTGAKKTVTTTLTAEQIAAQAAAAAAAAAAANAAELARQQAAADAESKRRQGQSAYDILLSEFNQYGLGSLVEPLKALIVSGPSSAELTLALRATDAYKKRFSANADRIAKGLSALNEREYLGMEDQYQNIMRNYGLPATYYAKDSMGTQAGFNQLLANDVSAAELEDRVMTAQSRVINSNPEIKQALRQFYPDITDGDILAYTLDPTKALTDIKRKVTAAEIGGAALTQAGLTTNLARAEELQRYGVDKESATAGYSTIGAGLQRGSELAAIYGESPYTQTAAESEVFKLSGAQEARKQRQKVTGLEKATFGGQTGLTSGALARDRAGGI